MIQPQPKSFNWPGHVHADSLALLASLTSSQASLRPAPSQAQRRRKVKE